MNLGSSTTDSSKTPCLLECGLCVVAASDVNKGRSRLYWFLKLIILGVSSLIKKMQTFTFKIGLLMRDF